MYLSEDVGQKVADKLNLNYISVTEDLKFFYYRGLKEWNNVRGYLIDTCLTAQDNFKALLDYFRIKQ